MTTNDDRLANPGSAAEPLSDVRRDLVCRGVDSARRRPCPRCGQLRWWFRERLGDVPLDASLSELNLDSLDVVELVMKAEREFEVSIAEEDYEHLRTVADVIRFISERIGDGPEPA